MAEWLKAKAGQLVDVAADIGEGASKLGDQLAGQASQLGSLLEGSAAAPGTRNLLFEAGVLGFQLDGASVVGVDKGGQALKLGVCVGDTLLAVAGYEVPTPAEDDTDAVQRRNRQIKKWIKEAPRPVRLTFKAVDAPSCKDNAPGDAAAAPQALEADLNLDDAFASLLMEEVANADGLEIGLDNSDSLAADAESTKAILQMAYGEANEQVRPDTQAVEAETVAASWDVSSDAAASKQASAATGQPLEAATEIRVDALSQASPALQDSLLEIDQAEEEKPYEETQFVAASRMEALGAELAREQEHRTQLSAELIQARHSRARVNADLETERRQNAAAQKKIVELQAQVATLTEQCSELRRAVDSSEKDDHIQLEASEAREQVLEDEVGRLRAACAALETNHQGALQAEQEKMASVEAKVAELQDMVSRQTAEAHELVARAVAAEGKQEIAESNLRRALEERTAEQLNLKAEHQLALHALRQQLRQQEEKAALELHETKLELESVRQSAQAAAKAEPKELTPEEEIKLEVEEIDDARGHESGAIAAPQAAPEADAADCSLREEESGEMVALRQRLAFLEQRCSTLQKQLNARPIVFQKPKTSNGIDDGTDIAGGTARHVSWEPYVRALAGPRIAQIAVHLYNIPDRALRNFTHKLLKHDAWLWVFYAHLLALYTIAASCYAETTMNTSNSPVDAINAGVAKVVAGAAPSVSAVVPSSR